MKFNTPKKIRFHHCDPAGIDFDPQVFYLLHEAQEDFLAHIGFPEHEMISAGYGVPIVDLKTEFLGMCRNGDDVTITVQLSKIGNTSLGMNYEVLKGESVKLRASGVVVYSKLPDGRPSRIPDDLRQAILPYLVNPSEEAP